MIKIIFSGIANPFSAMEIKQEETDKKGRFYAVDDNGEAGEMLYLYVGTGQFIIEHTEVFVGHEGGGVGKKLVNAAVDFARKKGIKIIPLCPYANTVLHSSDEYKDVLAKVD